MISEITYQADSTEYSRVSYQYKDNLCTSALIIVSRFNSRNENKYTHDEYGNVISVNARGGENLDHIQYEYDENGNWLRQLYESDGEYVKPKISIRQYEYSSKPYTITKNELIGTWASPDSMVWICFRENGLYDFGESSYRDDEIIETGTWKVDEQTQEILLTKRFEETPRKYNISSNGFLLVLKNNEGEYQFEKR